MSAISHSLFLSLPFSFLPFFSLRLDSSSSLTSLQFVFVGYNGWSRCIFLNLFELPDYPSFFASIGENGGKNDAQVHLSDRWQRRREKIDYESFWKCLTFVNIHQAESTLLSCSPFFWEYQANALLSSLFNDKKTNEHELFQFQCKSNRLERVKFSQSMKISRWPPNAIAVLKTMSRELIIRSVRMCAYVCVFWEMK